MSDPIQQLHNDALAIHRDALAAIDPFSLITPTTLPDLLPAPLDSFRRIRILAAGKASLPLAAAAANALGSTPFDGLAIVPHGYLDSWQEISSPAATNSPASDSAFRIPHSTFQILQSGHPVPDAAGLAAAERMLALARDLTAADLLLALISGGASALCPAFAPGISLADAQATFKLLLHSGAAIGEVNTVRKHLSRFGGGHLAAAAYPASICSLILSDVPGDDLATVSSGPTVADPTTFADARAILDRYDLLDRVPSPVRAHIERGLADPALETVKPGDPALARCRNRLIGNNRLAVEAAAARARELGYTVHVDPAGLTGEARDAGRRLAAAILSTSPDAPSDSPRAIVWGGETTVTVRGTGKGGRNQELALGAAPALESAPRPTLVAGFGTDGIDGPTDAAGAWATNTTAPAARARGLDPAAALENNNAYTFFAALESSPASAPNIGGLVKTGPTHTNVMDIALALIQ
jgi:hydroxypyruvate reductase